MDSLTGKVDHTPRALELANERAERWRRRCSALYKVNKKLEARLERVEKLLDEIDRDAKKNRHLARLSTRQVREVLEEE